MPAAISMLDALDDADASAVRALAGAAAARDNAPPLSDQALTRLHATGTVQHVLARDGNAITGYLQRDGDSIEVVADAATAPPLLAAVDPLPATVRIWSHGQRSPIEAALSARGMRPVRTLHRLHRRLDEPPPEPRIADGVRIRAFIKGVDESGWLAVNARAFAGHSEQGGWTAEDLLGREAEAWFDPAGFLLAEHGDQLIGFHWTKEHGDGLGEVYVLGVDPSAQGLGLGAALLAAGLAHLYQRGCREVQLYVDDDNVTAMRLYERGGFARADRDIQWAPA